MEIRISVADGDPADLESLSDWLRGERELGGRIKLTGPPMRDGDLGALTECLVVAAGSGGAITVVGTTLAGSLKTWLSQPRRAEVTIKVHRPDGLVVEVSARNVKAGDVNVETLIHQALDASVPQVLAPGLTEE